MGSRRRPLRWRGLERQKYSLTLRARAAVAIPPSKVGKRQVQIVGQRDLGAVGDLAAHRVGTVKPIARWLYFDRQVDGNRAQQLQEGQRVGLGNAPASNGAQAGGGKLVEEQDIGT